VFEYIVGGWNTLRENLNDFDYIHRGMIEVPPVPELRRFA
jgi:hypothetical protein